MEQFYTSPIILIIFSFIVSVLICYVAIPPIVNLAVKKSLFVVPNGRSAHKHATPSLGGIAIFAGSIISSLIFTSLYDINNLEYKKIVYFTAAALIIFFFGLKDDIYDLTPLKKLIAQLIAASIIVIVADHRFTNLHGFLHITEIPYIASVALSIFVIIVITNSFNLIDGIDGLASSIGIISLSSLAIWFYFADKIVLTIAAVSMIGALLAFIPFNYSKGSKKIFMGDSGSLVVGFFIAFLIIFFNELNIVTPNKKFFIVESAPSVSIGLIFLPLYDTLRVMTLRISNGISPFKADMLHLHHKLLQHGFSHFKSTLILSLLSLFVIAISFYFQNLGIFPLILIQLIFISTMYLVFFKLLKVKTHIN